MREATLTPHSREEEGRGDRRGAGERKKEVVISPTMSQHAICPPDFLVCLFLSESRNTVSIPTCSLARHDPLRSFPSCLLSSTKKSLSLLHITTKPSLFLYPIRECRGLQSGPPRRSRQLILWLLGK
jgi:hypothetical protein